MFKLPPDIQDLLTSSHQRRAKLVLVTGVFDVLHPEHTLFLAKAKQAGDVLLVALESDVRVKHLKGEDRPLNNQAERLRNLNRLQLADGIFILPEEFSKPEHHRQLIHLIKPTILAVSSHTLHQDKKQAIMDEVGGKVVVVHQHNPAISSTQLLASTST